MMRQLPENSSRHRNGHRAAHMIEAAASCDYRRFSTLYNEVETDGETSRKWAFLHLASAAAYYMSPADRESLIWRGITAHLDEVEADDTGPPENEVAAPENQDRHDNYITDTHDIRPSKSKSFLDRACERGLLILLSVLKDDGNYYRLGMEARSGHDAGLTMYSLALRAVDYLIESYDGDRDRAVADVEAEVFAQMLGDE